MDRSGALSALKFYSQGVIRLLIEPVLFFEQYPAVHTLGRALGFTALCAGFYAGAGLLTGPGPQSPVVHGIDLFYQCGRDGVHQFCHGLLHHGNDQRQETDVFPGVRALCLCVGNHHAALLAALYALVYRAVEILAGLYGISTELRPVQSPGNYGSFDICACPVVPDLFGHNSGYRPCVKNILNRSNTI